MKIFYIVLIFLLIQACSIPYSKYPLSKPDNSPIDKELLGLWYAQEDSNNSYYLIGINSSNTLFAHQMEQDKKGHIKNIEDFPFHTSAIKSGTFLNLWDQDWQAYYFMKYQIFSNDTLKLLLLNDNKIKKDILNNILQGSYKKGKSPGSHFKADTLTIEAPTADLIRYFNSQHHDSLFTDENYLIRLN